MPSFAMKVNRMTDEKTNPATSPAASIPGRPSNRNVLLALTVSFAINVAFWGSLLYWHWKSDSVQMAVGRCAVFVAVMAGVHFIGYRLWQRQCVQDQGDSNESPSSPISPAYWPPIKTALLQHGVILFLALGGQPTAHVALIAVLAYWLAFGVIVARRPSSPTQGDIRLIRYGFLLIFVVVFVVGPSFWEALGRM